MLLQTRTQNIHVVVALHSRYKKENMTTKYFECTECGARGKITLKGDDFATEDCVYCPVCSADIYEEEDELDDEE